jgi:hypothetical protein
MKTSTHLAKLLLLAWPVAAMATPTSFVPRSPEVIDTPFMRASMLPTTLSIDALTPAEIAQIRLDLYAELQQTKPWPSEGVDGCMAWFYKRGKPTESWQAFAYAVGGRSNANGAVKLNGALRPTRFHYDIPSDSERGFFGMKSKPGPGPGNGSAWISVFHARTSYRDMAQHRAADGALSDRLNIDQAEPEARVLRLLNTSSLRVLDPKMRCTDLKTQCRRYVLALDRPTVWQTIWSREEQPIALAVGAPLEIAIEDMCPFARTAMVEGAINTRIGGAEPDMKKYGLRRVEALRDVLKRHADEAAKAAR